MPSFRRFCILCAVLAGVAFPTWAGDPSLEIMIRAFIPDADHAGKGAKHVVEVGGKSVLKFLGSCFEGDNRGFSADYGATSRIGTLFRITHQEDSGDFHVVQGANLNKASWSNSSSLVSCGNGSALHELRPARLRTNEMKAVRRGKTVEISGRLGASNNAVRIGGMAIPDLFIPQINYEYRVVWNPVSGDVSAEFAHDKFPAYEMYVRSGGDPWRVLFRDKPQGSPWRLTPVGGRVHHEPVVLKKMFGQRAERPPEAVASAGRPLPDHLAAGAEIDTFPQRARSETERILFWLARTFVRAGVGELVGRQIGAGSQIPSDNSGLTDRLAQEAEGFAQGTVGADFTSDPPLRSGEDGGVDVSPPQMSTRPAPITPVEMCAHLCGSYVYKDRVPVMRYDGFFRYCECVDGGGSTEILDCTKIRCP